jgi:hypothetical protein
MVRIVMVDWHLEASRAREYRARDLELLKHRVVGG